MLFALGFISGLLVAIVIFVTLAFFRLGVERKVKVIQTRIENAGPKPKGSIYIPEDDASLAREEIIKRNKEQGRDTPIQDLM